MEICSGPSCNRCSHSECVLRPVVLLFTRLVTPYSGEVVVLACALLLCCSFDHGHARGAVFLSVHANRLGTRAPFNDLISQKTEELVTGTFTDTPFSAIQLFKDSLRSVYHSLKILALYLGLLLAALVLLLIPGIGSLLFTAAGTLLSAFMLSWEYLNYPLDRRKLSWKEKSRFFDPASGP